MVNTIQKHIQMYMHYALVGRYKCILIDLINLCTIAFAYTCIWNYIKWIGHSVIYACIYGQVAVCLTRSNICVKLMYV